MKIYRKIHIYPPKSFNRVLCTTIYQDRHRRRGYHVRDQAKSYNERYYFFDIRIVSYWNALTDHNVVVGSVDSFKRLLDITETTLKINTTHTKVSTFLYQKQISQVEEQPSRIRLDGPLSLAATARCSQVLLQPIAAYDTSTAARFRMKVRITFFLF